MKYTFNRSAGGEYKPYEDIINISVLIPEKNWKKSKDMEQFLVAQLMHEHTHRLIFRMGESIETTARYDLVDTTVRSYLFPKLYEMLDKYGLRDKSNEEMINYYVKQGVLKKSDKMRDVAIILTKAEVNHLLALIEMNEDEGWYYGYEKRYRARSTRIKTKLEKA